MDGLRVTPRGTADSRTGSGPEAAAWEERNTPLQALAAAARPSHTLWAKSVCAVIAL